jgi:hypothetical protein
MEMEALAVPLLVAVLAAIGVGVHRASRSSGERGSISKGEPAKVDAPVTHIPCDGSDDDIAHWMWGKLVPEAGQSLTVQGELLRAVAKLRREAQGNGNINWDEGFERFIDLLHKHLVEKSTLSNDRKLPDIKRGGV